MCTGCHDLFYFCGSHVSEGVLHFGVQLSDGVFRVYYKFINIVFGVFFQSLIWAQCQRADLFLCEFCISQVDQSGLGLCVSLVFLRSSSVLG